MMYFEDLSRTTKKAGGFIANYRNNMNQSLYDVYQKPSFRKVKIFDALCKQLKQEANAYNFTVVSGGSGYFTMACENDTHYFYITFSHNYRIEK